MEFIEYLLVLLACFGLFALIFLLFGRLLMPVGGGKTRIVIALRAENGAELEHAVRGLNWLCASGALDAQAAVIVDDLDDDVVETAEYLEKRGLVELLSAGGLEDYIRQG